MQWEMTYKKSLNTTDHIFSPDFIHNPISVQTVSYVYLKCNCWLDSNAVIAASTLGVHDDNVPYKSTDLLAYFIYCNNHVSLSL